MRNYKDLMKLKTFEERFEYLKLGGEVGKETFGYDRYLNQRFYHSAEWKRIRNQVIVRDNGCDLAIPDREIIKRVYIHHMNPIEQHDIIHGTDFLINPDYLICCSRDTHNAIHYGDANLLLHDPVVRRPNDTCPWKS